MAKISKPEYEEKVKKLSEEEIERLLSRMSGKLPRRLQKEKLSLENALAIQMELEDEQLQEWRKMMAALNKKEAAKAKAAKTVAEAPKEKTAAKAKTAPKTATKAKTKPVAKPAATPKAGTTTKTKSAAARKTTKP